MSRLKARSHYQRARRDAEKEERRDAILAAADALLRASGFEAFSMAVLAKKTGMAKGTLYLYFATREEVLLALTVESQAAWSRALVDGLHEGIGDAAFIEHFLATSLADPNFLELHARLGSVIEQNVSVARLVEAKRSTRDLVGALTHRLEHCLELAPGDGVRVFSGLGLLLLGAWQMDAGPTLQGDLPDDVVEFAQLFAHADVFRDHARRLLAGIRATAA